MKYLYLALAVFLTGCGATTQTKPEGEAIATKNANQHMAVGVTLAMFYCEQSRWPMGAAELQEFAQSKELPLPVKIDWDWLSRSNVGFIFGENVALKTPAGESKDEIAVSSLNKPPKWDGNNVEVDIAINMGE